ncbi:HAD-IA family hydrolase [Candidatus Peregrinibacteria bacterium]|nr:HAD-IA family hydrolase [Candidatus Peregrinibacteria bacterium]
MKAIIFDMDGVIIDSEKHWKKAELTFFGKLLPCWTKKDQQKIIGINVHETYRILANDYGLSLTHREFIERVNSIALEVYRKKCSLIDGFLDLVKKLTLIPVRGGNLKIALASSSLNEWIDIALERFELRPFFDVVVSAEDINAPGKPKPDIYLYTARKLGVGPDGCLVIEDSHHGVAAAKSAGMVCVGLRNGFNEQQDLSAADVIMDGFTDRNNQKIINFFNHD